ncbi:MAG: SNF2-related protein, partial [Gemmatimonadaceae bacterium]
MTRARGEEYARSRRVEIVAATKVAITAEVRGTARYLVSLEAAPGVVRARCNCRFALDNGLCEHVWATLRHADAQRTLAPLVERAGLRARLIAVSVTADDDVDGHPEHLPIDEAAVGDHHEQDERPSSARHDGSPTGWKAALRALHRDLAEAAPQSDTRATWPDDRRPVYLIDLTHSIRAGAFIVDLATEKQTRDSAAWEPPAPFRLGMDVFLAYPDPIARQIAQMLVGARPPDPYGLPQRPTGFMLRGAAVETILRLMCESGRCRLRRNASDRPTRALAWDADVPWRLRIQISTRPHGGYFASAVLERHGDEMPLSDAALLLSDGWLVANGTVSRLDHRGAFAVVRRFRETPEIDFAADDLAGFLDALYAIPRLPPIELPVDSGIVEARDAPRPCLTVLSHAGAPRAGRQKVMMAFKYGDRRIPADLPADPVFDPVGQALRYRDRVAEAAARSRLPGLGVTEEWDRLAGDRVHTVAAESMPALVRELLAADWEIDFGGEPVVIATGTRATVRSGIDWFELDAAALFGEFEVSLADMLAARRAGALTVPLPNGTLGILPAEWLEKLGPLAAGGAMGKGSMRYTRSQVALLDAMLSTIPDADIDATFEKARAELRGFDRIEPVDPTPTFTGTLRGYQREGLGWLHFLRRFDLGGCLADDMGLGKTVQVLAMLDARRVSQEGPPRPSIVVVPRSLVFNWIREAARFTPHLRVLDYSGPGRAIDSIDVDHVDVVIITYGTLRLDAPELSAVEFDYAILDEAQAIKNATS